MATDMGRSTGASERWGTSDGHLNLGHDSAADSRFERLKS